MHILKRFAPACLAALAAGLIAASPVAAQQERQPAAGAPAGNTDLYFPTGEEATSLLMIRAQAPEEVRVGQAYNYQLTVRNITDNVTLEDIRIQHESTDYVSIEGAQVAQQGQQGQAQQGQQGQGQQGDANVPVEDRPEGQQGQNQGQQGQQGQHDHGQQGQAQQGQGRQGQGGNAVQIGELGPGESRTVSIRAVAEQEGTAGVCFRVAYTPTVCLVTRFTKPEIQVIKAVPEVADICQPLRFEYTVRNTGSAAVENVVVTDNLPDGLRVRDGEQDTVRREIGNLPAGEAREFTVDLCALRTGRFTSRAVAQSGDLRAQSNSPTTRIVAARLSAEMEGPEAQYLNQPATYRVTVRNEGDGPALDTRLEVDVDERTRLIRTSRTSLNSVAPSQGDDRTLVWNIDRLEPGEETAVSFTVNMARVPQAAESREPEGGGQDQQRSEGSQVYTFRHVAEVTSRCADAEMCADEEIRKYATAQAALEVELVTIPALLLEMVDRYDQVTVGENVDYVLTIINQGSGTDTNVQLSVQLPDSLEFVRADGKTEAQADGQTVTFQPIETFAPGEEARFEVVAKANRAGQISTNAELNSDFLSVPAREAEPTVLIGEGATNVRSSDSQGQGNQNQNNPNQGNQNQNQNQGSQNRDNNPNGGNNDN